jgi:dipeptidyl-peptidase-3
VFDKDGNLTDVTLDYTEGYAEQHLRYSRDYSPLPDVNE